MFTVVTVTASHTNVIGPFLMKEDAVEWANRWMEQGLGIAGVAGLLDPEEAAGWAGFEWRTEVQA
jgi:hypothetical protein